MLQQRKFLNKFKGISIFFIFATFLLMFSFTRSGHAGSIDRLRGMILLQVESKGEAWYVEPTSGKRILLGSPTHAFEIMRQAGLGISNLDLAKIPGVNEMDRNQAFVKKLSGRILLQTESKGQAWYVHPGTLKKYPLGRPADALAMMRSLGLGIKNSDLMQISEKTLNNSSVVTPIAASKPPTQTIQPSQPDLSPQLAALIAKANPSITLLSSPQSVKVNEFFTITWRIDLGETLFAHNIGLVYGPNSNPDPKGSNAYPSGTAPLCARGCNAPAPSNTTSESIVISTPGKYYIRMHASFYGIDKWSEERVLIVN